MTRKLRLPMWLVLWGSLAAMACASKQDDAAPAPVVVDLHASCTQRVGWANLTKTDCTNCNARASLN